MVGVPRSSGCRICVQRRVRCDGARPTCNNCRKGNRPCPGYGPGFKFQDEGAKLREKYQKEPKRDTTTHLDDRTSSFTVNHYEEDWNSSLVSFTPSSITSSGPTTPQSKQWNILGLDLDDVENAGTMNVFSVVEGKIKSYLDIDVFELLIQGDHGYDAAVIPRHDPCRLLKAPVMSPQAQQLQLLSNFTQSLIPSTHASVPPALRGQGAWLSHLPGLTGANLLLDTAVRAVTLVHVGILHKNEVFLMESRPYYGKALRLLNTAIVDKEMGMDNKTLCATILLSFYEMFASDDDASWVRHAGGAATLMRMRGAERHRHGFDRDIFLAYRHTLVIEAFSNDVISFLDEPEWRELSAYIYTTLVDSGQIPKNRVPVFDLSEEFFNEMVSISTSNARLYYLNTKLLETGTVDPNDKMHETFRKLQREHDNLQKLQRRWEAILKTIGQLPPLTPTSDPVIPFQYQYMNVFIASFNMGMWTTTMLTNCMLYPLSVYLDLDTTALVAENEECAMEACRSVEFMPTSSFLGPFFTIYALRFCFRIFKPGDIRKDWALCKLVEIGDRRMTFAKGVIGGADAGETGTHRPLDYIADARRRLDAYVKDHAAQLPA